MPIQAPQWTEFLSCPVCCNGFDGQQRCPISLRCGHTICKACLSYLQSKQCPIDHTTITIDIDTLPVNSALLQLMGIYDVDDDSVDLKIIPSDSHEYYLESKRCIEELAMYLKPYSNGSVNGSGSILSRPMQRKLVTLINCQLAEDEGRARALRSARSLGERTVTELILLRQNPQQLSANLWAAVRARGCQFLGPAMQEEVLKLVLLALEDGSALCRKVLVMFVVQRLEPHFPQASKTSIGHVVQLLYRASCFKVSKREGDSSLMQLKEEFRTYDALRREHDAQIVQIATEAGLRIAPDQWSALLYGDTNHKSHMQSIIDKMQTPQSFAQSVQELVIALQRTGDATKLSILRPQLELLASIDSNSEIFVPTWKETWEVITAVHMVVAGLADFIQAYGCKKIQVPTHFHNKYKISMCRDLILRGNCPRGSECTFAHSDEEMERYRMKSKKLAKAKEYNGDNYLIISDNCNPQTEDYYPIANSSAVAPVAIPTVVQIQPIGYDLTFAQNYSPVSGFPVQQTIYATPASCPDLHPSVSLTNTSHNIISASEHGTFFQRNMHNAWEDPNLTNQTNGTPVKFASRRIMGTLLELNQRKQEVLSQLEKFVGKNAVPIPNQHIPNTNDMDCKGIPYTFWTESLNPVTTFVRSDSILAADDDCVPYDSLTVGRFGPIKRMQKDIDGIVPLGLTDSCLHGFQKHPVSISTSTYNNSSSNGSLGGTTPTKSVITNEDGSSEQQCGPQEPTKELIAQESSRVRIQLCNLEKQLHDLKVATKSMRSFSERDRLTRELQLIEQDIQDKQKEVCLYKLSHSLSGHKTHESDNIKEDMYEADIANDMKELELKWHAELEQQEQCWSSDRDSIIEQ